MKINFINGASWLEELARELEKLGHEITPNCDKNTDIIMGMSVTQIDRIRRAHNEYPSIPMLNYNWDVYSWVWTRPREGEYDYKLYGELLKQSKYVLVPSTEEAVRTKNWFDIDAVVVKTYIPFWDYEIKDDNYVFQPLREIPDDNLGWFENICDELEIPYISNKHHDHKHEDLKRIVASCSFIVSPYREASTGSLDIIQGYYMGKPVLIFGNENGGRDYLGNATGVYYCYDKEDMKKWIKDMWENRRIVPEENRSWVKKKYTAENMAKQINDLLCLTLEKR